jgi:hypothetical protein
MRSVERVSRAALLACLIWPAIAFAEHAPAIVVPGRPGVPVVINGFDVTGAVIEGDWGLSRPGHGVLTVIPPYVPPIIYGPPAPRYFPKTGHRPRYGRREGVPPANRRLPPPAEPYYRNWGVQSDPGSATSYPPYDPPAVIMAPRTDDLPRGR